MKRQFEQGQGILNHIGVGFPQLKQQNRRLELTIRPFIYLFSKLDRETLDFENNTNKTPLYILIKGENQMKPGELFETECYEYLKSRYTTAHTSFQHLGGMNSTLSDIAVVKSGKIVYFIEAKMSEAQSGQFVLIPDEDSEMFIFSPKNHSEPNEMTKKIISYMNLNFKEFNNAGTAGKTLKINTDIFSDWIIQHYQANNVKYFISYKNGYVIFPIHKFDEYFSIEAKYRIKKSGSREPASKNISSVKAEILKIYPEALFSQNQKKLFASISERVFKERFILGDYTYFLSLHEPGIYEVRCLSNTKNMNVIFSVSLKKGQEKADLDEFEADL